MEEIVLLHVIDRTQIKRYGGSQTIGQAKLKGIFTAIDRGGRKLLDRMADAAQVSLNQAKTSSGTKIKTVLAHGRTAETIINQAARRRVNLVLIGSKGLSDIQGFLLGSISRKVVSHAPCSVLAVKRPIPSLSRVILALDGSTHAKAAADLLRKWPMPDYAHLTVLSVVPPVSFDVSAAATVLSPSQSEALLKAREEEARQLVASYREMFLKEGCAVHADVLTGSPSQMIVRHAERTRADLVVVGHRGRTGQAIFPMGNVSEGVVTHIPCSVLVVRK